MNYLHAFIDTLTEAIFDLIKLMVKTLIVTITILIVFSFWLTPKADLFPSYFQQHQEGK